MKTVTLQRCDERGAALITTLLLATLLLAAGGILLMVTAITGTNAVDSTAEVQAYYAAEAGIAQTLKVIRGNEASNPAGTTASFRNIVSDRTKWSTLSGNRITVSGSIAFSVDSITDPDDVDGSIRTSNAAYKPSRLKVQITGYGPSNSKKRMEFVVNRLTTNFSVNATITLPNTSGAAINFNLGNSNVTNYSGLDAASNPNPSIAAFGVAGSDQTAAQNVINGCQSDGTQCGGNGPNVTPTTPMVLDNSNTPSFLKSVTDARSFLYGTDGMMNTASAEGRYFTNETDATNSTGGLGASSPNGQLTFVDGDFTLGPGSPTGQGLLIVTGTLTLHGNFQWNGVIMVLGTGRVLRSGGGHGNIFGAMFVANFSRTGAATDTFGAPTFNTSGGGTANIQYNSDEIDKAKGVGGHHVVAVREY
jgi:hypothetical protein